MAGKTIVMGHPGSSPMLEGVMDRFKSSSGPRGGGSSSRNRTCIFLRYCKDTAHNDRFQGIFRRVTP